MENNNHIHQRGRAFSGIIILIIGVCFLLNNLNLNIPQWIFRWHTFLIGLGLFIGARCNFRGIKWLVLVLVGAYFTLNRIPELGFDLSKYALGTGLVILGIFILLRPKRSAGYNPKWNRKFEKTEPVEFYSDPKFKSNDFLELTSIFGGNDQTIISKSFKGGEITAVFGGANVNLTQSDFEDTVSLDVTAVFGGIKLIIPPNWIIKSNVTAVFGSVEDKRGVILQEGVPQKVLILEGIAMFGGIDIKSY
ncbi:LiaF transmembrane domain-containing protein [Pedobacter sp. MW01-1-1]|uniref:LiaF transmembrane domain-containing protein n=1 Tax=Pedobacter sp. MW01-1-1 TaxID=3383027 RepID=UPI003FEFCEA8